MVIGIIFTPDNKRIITGDALGHVVEWDVTNGRQLITHNLEPEDAFTCLAFSPDTTAIAAGTKRGLVHLYNLEHEEEDPPLPCSNAPIKDIVFSHDGMLIAVGGADQVSIWNRLNETCLYTCEQSITCLTFSPDDEWLALGCRDGCTYIQELSSSVSQKIPSKRANAVTCLAFSPDSKKIGVGKENAPTQIWSRKNTVIDSADWLAELSDQSEHTIHLAFSSDSSCIITAGKSGTLRARDIMQAIQFQRLNEQVDKTENIVLSASGDIALTLTKDQQIHQWNIDSIQEPRVLFRNLAGQTERLMCIASHLRGKLFGVGTLSGHILLGDTDHPGNQVELGQHKGRVTCLAFSPDGSILATGSNDKTAHLYDTTTRQQIKVLFNHSGSVDYLTFAPDNANFVTSSTDGILRFWNIATGTCSESILKQNMFIEHLCITPSGDTLIAGNNNGEVYAWTKTGSSYSEPLCFSSPTSSEITALTCAPWERLLIVCYSNHQTDFIYLTEFPIREMRLIGKVTTNCIINAIHWKDARHLILAGIDEMACHPNFYHFILEGNWLF